MPLLFPISQDQKHYMEFQAEDLILNLRNQDLRGMFVRKFRTNSHQECTTALCEDDNTAFKRVCRYSLVTQDNKPEIHVRNYPELSLTNIAKFTVWTGKQDDQWMSYLYLCSRDWV